jgi:outer membrane protein assembly factor BamA
MFKTGPRVRVGATRIINDTAYSKYGHVRDHVILRQMSLDSGAWFRNSDRLASERDIGRLGTFQYINIELDSSAFAKLPDSAKNGLALPVLTYLRMRPSWEITPGPYAGISAFNQFILGLGASYSNRNIFGGAENLTLQASYQFLPSNQKRATLGGDLVFPYFLFKNVPLTLSPNYTYSDQRSVNSGKLQFLERITSANAGLNFQLSNDPSPIIPLTLKGSLQYVNRDYRDSSIFNGHIDNTTVPTQFNIIGSIDLSFNWTNDPQNPSHGSFIGFSLQRTLPIPVANLPSAAYTKLTPQFKTFFNLSSTDGRSVLGYRILYGNVWLDHPDDQSRDILIENRYFGGGTNSLRGWPARTLLVSNNSTPGHPQFGGYKTVETNLEWRYAPFHYPVEITAAQQFFSALRIAFFCDAGNVWDKDVPIAVKNFAIAVGTGIRYNTLVGAIRFDFGFKLYDPFPDAYPPGTKGVDKPNKDILLAMPPNSSTGVWLFNRKGWKLGDILNIEFALGQAF